MTDARSQGSRDAKQKRQKAMPRPCPICGAEVSVSSENFPFCSKRCRLVDLGRWFSGTYAISREISEDEL